MKLKSKSAAKKRFRKTGAGKIVGAKAGRGHLLMQKSSRQKKLANKVKIYTGGEAHQISRMLPNL